VSGREGGREGGKEGRGFLDVPSPFLVLGGRVVSCSFLSFVPLLCRSTLRIKEGLIWPPHPFALVFGRPSSSSSPELASSFADCSHLPFRVILPHHLIPIMATQRCNGTPAAPTASSSLSSPLCWRNWRDSRGSERWVGLSVEHVEEGEERVIEHREGEPRGGHGINEKSLPFAGRGRDVRCRRWPAVTGEVRVERL